MIRIGYAAGAFDLFHVGHLHLLRSAKMKCDYLIAGVVSDEMLRRRKCITPVVPQEERVEIVRSIGCVNEAVIEDASEKIEMWHRLKFDIVFKGDDWQGTAKGDKLERDFSGIGVGVVYLPRTVSTSSMEIRAAILSVKQLADSISSRGALGRADLGLA
jgi:glycerol-3-phosphate cytidylyltransferase